MATNMMPRNLRTIPTLLMISLLAICGLAAAGPLDVAGSGSASGGAGVSTDGVHGDGALDSTLSGHVADAVDGGLAAHAKGALDAQLPDVQAKVDDAKATVDGKLGATTDATGGVMAGLKANLAIFGSWIHGLFGAVHGDASASANGVVQGDGANAGLDGAAHLGADVQQPQPELGFMGKLKSDIVGMLHF